MFFLWGALSKQYCGKWILNRYLLTRSSPVFLVRRKVTFSRFFRDPSADNSEKYSICFIHKSVSKQTPSAPWSFLKNSSVNVKTSANGRDSVLANCREWGWTHLITYDNMLLRGRRPVTVLPWDLFQHGILLMLNSNLSLPIVAFDHHYGDYTLPPWGLSRIAGGSLHIYPVHEYLIGHRRAPLLI